MIAGGASSFHHASVLLPLFFWFVVSAAVDLSRLQVLGSVAVPNFGIRALSPEWMRIPAVSVRWCPGETAHAAKRCFARPISGEQGGAMSTSRTQSCQHVASAQPLVEESAGETKTVLACKRSDAPVLLSDVWLFLCCDASCKSPVGVVCLLQCSHVQVDRHSVSAHATSRQSSSTVLTRHVVSGFPP